jgi:hypothetical protein
VWCSRARTTARSSWVEAWSEVFGRCGQRLAISLGEQTHALYLTRPVSVDDALPSLSIDEAGRGIVFFGQAPNRQHRGTTYLKNVSRFLCDRPAGEQAWHLQLLDDGTRNPV